MFKSKTGLLLLSTALVGTPALSQDVSEIFLGTVRIGGVEAQSVLGNEVIDEEDLERRNPISLPEVFSGESSILVSAGAAIAQKVFVNGIEESLLAVTIDGARQNKSVFHHTGNVPIDPSILQAVSVSEGIAPADAGPGALAGLIAYEVVSAVDLLEPGDTFGGRVTLGYTEAGDTLRTTLTMYGMAGNFDYLFSANRIQGDDYENGDNDSVDGTEADLTALTGKFGLGLDNGARLEFTIDHVEDTGLRPIQRGNIRPDFEGLTSDVTVEFYQATSERDSYILSYTGADGGGFSPSVQLSYNEQYIDAGLAEGTNTSLNGYVENVFALGDAELTAGIDFFRDTAEAHGDNTVGGYAEEVLTNVGVYAQMRQDIGDNLSLSYGLRYDNQVYELADGTEHSADGVSANAAVDIRLNDAWTINAGAAHTWGGYELSEAALINYGSTWVYGTPNAATSTNLRLGLRYEANGLTMGAAVFSTEIEDADYILTADRLTSDLKTEGFELSAGYDWGAGFVRVNYTNADVTVDGSTISTTAYYYGRPVGEIIAIEAAHQFNSEWTVGGTAEIALENEDTSIPLAGYEVVNLFASYRPTRVDGLEVRFDVENLFDQTYSHRSNDGLDLTSRVYPLTEPGRNIGVTVNYEF